MFGFNQLETITFCTTAVMLVGTAIIIALERKYPYTPGLPFFRKGFWIDVVWYTLIQSFILKVIIFDFFIYPLRAHLSLPQSLSVAEWPLVVQVLFFLVVHDFYIYWFHRAQHENKWLWRTHEAHHSNTEVDWIAGARSHSFEILINQTVEFAPIILLSANPAVVPIKACLDALWGNYIHANLNVKSGWLQYIINGPEMHQWHHADDRRVFWANYATKFAVWDWLFGTAWLPKDEKPARFGLYYPYPKDYFLQHSFAVKRFDVEALEQHPRLKNYFGLRQWLMAQVLKQQTSDALPQQKAEPHYAEPTV